MSSVQPHEKHKGTLLATYKALTKPILEYASTMWSFITSTTYIAKLQTIQNTALHFETGCTLTSNIYMTLNLKH